MISTSCLDKDTEIIFTIITCSSSILSGSITLSLSLISNSFEALTKRIIILFSFNSIARSILDIISIYITGPVCILISYLKNIFLISNVIWSGFISKTLDEVITRRQDYKPRFFFYCLIASYIVFPLFHLLPLITNSLESNECQGIKTDFTGLMWRMSLVYFPCLAIIGVTFYYYYRMYRCIRARGDVKFKGILIDRGLLYSIIFVLIFVILVAFRILDYLENEGADCFIFSASFLIGIQGVLILGITVLREDFRELLCCSRNRVSRAISEGDYISLILK